MDMCGHFIVKAIFFQLIEDYRINKPGTEVWFVLSSWYYTSEFNKLQLRIKVRIVIALTSFMAWHGMIIVVHTLKPFQQVKSHCLL